MVLGDQVYGPYGNRRVQQGTISTSKGFTGQFTDFVAGLDYYGARYYDPVVGVFVSADVVQGNARGMNPYGYVGGNPETYTDPTGYSWNNEGASIGGPAADGGGPVVDGGGATTDGGGTTPDRGGSTTDGGSSTPDGGSDSGRGGGVSGQAIDLTLPAQSNTPSDSSGSPTGTATGSSEPSGTGTGSVEPTATTGNSEPPTATSEPGSPPSGTSEPSSPEATSGNTTSNAQNGSSRAQRLRIANNVGNGRNIAIVDYNVDGSAGSKWASSGPDFKGSIPKPTNPDFDATPTGNNLRDADSEYKLLNWLSERLNPGDSPTSDVSGTIDLYTERPPCPSCANVIRQFQMMFPKINVNVTYGP